MLLFRLKQEINPMLFGHSFKIIHHLAHERNDVYTLYLHLHLLVLNLTEVQYLIDKTKHTAGVPFHHHQLFTGISRQFIILQDLLYRTCYQRKRSTQLMGYIRKEAQFYIRNLLFDRHFMLQPVNGEQDINGHKNNNQNEKYIKHVCYRRFPERRQNDNIQDTFVIHPHTIAISRTDAKHILSFRKIRISHATLFIGKGPLFFKSIENISILYILRISIIECREMNGENILLMRKNQFISVVNIHFQQ